MQSEENAYDCLAVVKIKCFLHPMNFHQLWMRLAGTYSVNLSAR